ncbi:Fe-S cluster biogenesis protein NfuA, 4Fe-4S-binding domain [Nocardia amikacinitolerans]|uniref:Fe-S cluster biogenesis protein NfuA, 4Fe-4S-binding domain n=1 Tax=Nocardia amikacinitolerans TaxID=756689 RepID=A0A285KUV0_9NOCA|nr:NifU family protein [Nocardia amikacinitolerans]MCP2275871.1 Fe-S cluster biogenesis protein NfuA, 4Fe-4S-binding domain [Nocardia amikacinitolerans]MCP2294142.1 Fe-S cluster biogenesis protein NfuA, 4Fe-4S-binding domain [Nocardia amikacinitolerans]SNY76395.1 Fe-S cluster biogenesis protein NfuA, 4Fe-4S-binding domain [Nocardia amikacinitolerans]
MANPRRERGNGHDEAVVDDDRWRGAGERIETLLESSSVGGAAARERAEELVREVADLYGAGLERIVGMLDDTTLERLAGDDLIASLLLVHGLHPHDVVTRVRTALDSVRPYLGSHGGDVELIEIEDGIVRLELAGSCRTCPSSSVTLELAVEDAVRAAAPEIEAIEVVAAEPESGSGVIAAESLFARVHAAGSHAGSWIAVPELAAIGAGEVGGFAVAGVPVLACRVGDELFVYRDRCGACGRSMAGAVLHRRLGFPVGDAVLRCPSCGAHFDAVHAGARVDGDGHLEPLPVLVRSGELSVAVPAEVAG